MKVQLFVSKDLEESHAEIYTDILTDNIQKAMVLLEDEDLEGNIDGKNSILAVKKGKDIVILEFDDIYMFRVEDKQLKVFTEKSEYLLWRLHINVNISDVKPHIFGSLFYELKLFLLFAAMQIVAIPEHHGR